jgi:hypothetical protein
MEIRDATTGCFVRLTPLQYQYPSLVGIPFDSDWLVIKGRVRSLDEQWTFVSAILLAGEAADIVSWLRSVAAADVPPMEAEDGVLLPTLVNIEPNIGLGLVSSAGAASTIRVFLCLESAPPSTASSYPSLDYFLDLTLSTHELNEAAAALEAELVAFPSRA